MDEADADPRSCWLELLAVLSAATADRRDQAKPRVAHADGAMSVESLTTSQTLGGD